MKHNSELYGQANGMVRGVLNRITPEEHLEYEREFQEMLAHHRWMEEMGLEYCTDTSPSLVLLRENGFNPIGITSFMCEELMIFNTKTKAEKAYKSLEVKKGLISCYFYSKNQFQKEVSDDKYFNSKIYWLTDKQKPTWKARVGEKHTTKEGCEFELLVCNNQKECTIKFLEPPFTILNNISYVAILGGGIKNHYHKSLYGVGYFGIGKYKSQENGKKTRCYTAWINMLKRCYSEKVHNKQKEYKDCVVLEDWHNFQVFADWHKENWKPWMGSTWELDKDILIKGNKIYSPETCCFLPKQINCILTNKKKKDSGLPIGVSKAGNKYSTMVRNKNHYKYIGTFNTPEEAFEAYKTVKESCLKELANEWKDKITEEVYITLYNYQI